MMLPPPLSLVFWFDPIPPPFVPSLDRLILIASVVCIAVGLLAPMIRRGREMDWLARDVMTRASTTFLVTGCIGLILYGLAFERVPYLSMRIFWIPLVAWLGWRCWRHDRRMRIEIPKIRAARMEREKFEKWLPKHRG